MIPVLSKRIKQLFKRKVFDEHFSLHHRFDGIEQNQIKETYIVKPISTLAVQLFFDGVQIAEQRLHLMAKVKISHESVEVHILSCNPEQATEIVNRMKKILIEQLSRFEKRFNNNPLIQYVQPFCQSCRLQNTKPLNECVKSCRYTPLEPSENS